MSEPEPNVHIITCDLPEDAIVEHALGVASYFDTEGKLMYSLTMQGDAHVTQLLGLLELVKARVLREAENW